MAVNFLDLATGYLSDPAVERIGNLFGETPQHTRAAFNGALPLVLNGLVLRSAEPGGTSSVMDMVAEVTTPNRAAGEIITSQGAMLGRLSALFNGHATTEPIEPILAMGSEHVASLFGNRVNAMAGALASYSGVSLASASSLLNVAAPLLLGVIEHTIAENGDGPMGLATLLNGQTGFIQSALPPGLLPATGNSTEGSASGGPVDKPGNLTQGAPAYRNDAAEQIPDSVTPVPTAVDADRPVAGIPAYNSEHAPGPANPSRWWLWLLIVGVAILLYYLFF